MRVLVCGGRDFNNYMLLSSVLENYPITVLIHGNARGADKLAEFYGQNENLVIERYIPDWDKHGKAAGFIRNQEMLDTGKPDLVVAFPGGNGTADMIRRAKKAQVPVIVIEGE